MNARHEAPSPGDLADEVGGLTVGLGIITMTLSPFALPGLVLVLPLVLPLVPVLLVGGAVYLLARVILLPMRLARRAWQAWIRSHGAAPQSSRHTHSRARRRPVWCDAPSGLRHERNDAGTDAPPPGRGRGERGPRDRSAVESRGGAVRVGAVGGV